MSSTTTARGYILLVEIDPIVRFGLAVHLRGCGYRVAEAANAGEARDILAHTPELNILFCDAELDGIETGFALAKWARQHVQAIEVILAASCANKAQCACALCDREPGGEEQSDPAALSPRIGAMKAAWRRGCFEIEREALTISAT